MPYLNWKQAPVRKSVSEQVNGPSEFRLVLSASETQALGTALGETFASTTSDYRPELRVDLPDHWILFFKLREGESRLLLAHPQKNEWVSTLALAREHAEKWVEALRALTAGSTIDLRSLGAVDGISNVDLVIEGQ